MRCNSLANNDLTHSRQSTKDFVRNFNLFMQNEPKFQKPKIAINYCPQRTYTDFAFSKLLENEPKRTQNEPKLKNAKIKLIHYLKRIYNNFPYFELFKNEPKRTQTNPKRTQFQRPRPSCSAIEICRPVLAGFVMAGYIKKPIWVSADSKFSIKGALR